mgnify:FL=1
MKIFSTSKVNSKAEELFVELFVQTFGPEKANNLFVQYPFVDILGNHRYIDFALETQDVKIAIEIDGETYHNPKLIPDNKYFDDLLKQNSMIYQDWRVYRWAYKQLLNFPEVVRDQLITFLGETPYLKEMQTYLPTQKGKIIELRDYQQDAIDNLSQMREDGETIALLYHATGIGKTVTAATDAKLVGGRTLFLVNALTLADQAFKTFESIWPEVTKGYYTGSAKEKHAYVLFATVQSISKNLVEFLPNSFDYICIDECHHAATKTYQQILSYFKPKFILGLSATPERTDGEDMLKLFQNVAHKMDLQTAVKQGILAPIRCIRLKTDIDLSDVRINGVKYNALDLESKLFIPERNSLIADTYVELVNGRNTVIFCASVDHAEEIARLLRIRGVRAESVSGRDKLEVRKKILHDYEHGTIHVLCACDLLNEGWDSPRTEVLFMARPTMSKIVYMQQLGRGTRKSEGKEDLLVIDFVDNANMFNMPYSLHRLLNVSEYRPLQYVLAPEDFILREDGMLRYGDKPLAYLDVPIHTEHFAVVDLFNWQDDAKNMISQLEFVRMVDVQSETIDKYIRDKKIVPDLSVPISENRFFHYFNEDTVKSYAKQFRWELITNENITEKFLEFIKTMDMAYSYKPVLLLAILEHMDYEKGIILLSDIIQFVTEFYEDRRNRGLIVEKATSIYAKGGFSDKDVERNILANPFKRFSDMRFLRRSKDLLSIEFNPIVYKNLKEDDFDLIRTVSYQKLEDYYRRIDK